jgi:hypothetical protein
MIDQINQSSNCRAMKSSMWPVGSATPFPHTILLKLRQHGGPDFVVPRRSSSPSTPSKSFAIPTLQTNSNPLQRNLFQSQGSLPSCKVVMEGFDVTQLFNVQGLVAVVTGGGTGIGLCIHPTPRFIFTSAPSRTNLGVDISSALAQNGATVYIVGRRPEKLGRAVKMHKPVSPTVEETYLT